jgi:Leucine-rich repeat (LRR) protein
MLTLPQKISKKMKFHADNTEYRSQNELESVFFGNAEKALALILSNVPGTSHHYIEWNDQSNACTNGVKKIQLSNDELYIQLTPEAAALLGETELTVGFDVDATTFAEIKRCLSLIFGDMLLVKPGTIATKTPPIKDYSQIKYLNLEGKNLTQLPDYVAQMTALETAKLGYNPKLDLHAAFDVLSRLPNLKDLTISAEAAVADNLGQLTALETLTINGLTKPCTLPESIGQLKKLKYLLLMSDSEVVLPESFADLAALEELYLRVNGWNLPSRFYQLSRLTQLDFTNCRIAHFPTAMAQMPAIETVILDNTVGEDLDEILSVVARMQHLKTLELGINPVPKAIRLCRQIEELIIRTGFDYENPLQLPDEIFELSELHILMLQMNNLEQIPAAIGQLKGLKQLIIQESNVETLPDSIAELTNLELLFLSENPNLKSLPENLGQLTQLRELYLTDNPQLTELPASVQYLTNLTAVRISDFENMRHIPDSWKPLLIEG